MKKETFKKTVEAIIMKQVKADIAEEKLNNEYNDLAIETAIDILMDTIKVSKVKIVNVILDKGFIDFNSINYTTRYTLFFNHTKYTIMKDLTIAFFE